MPWTLGMTALPMAAIPAAARTAQSGSMVKPPDKASTTTKAIPPPGSPGREPFSRFEVTATRRK